MHWALLYTIGALFVSTFILFETGGSFSNEGRHILFTVLCGLMSFVLVVRTARGHRLFGDALCSTASLPWLPACRRCCSSSHGLWAAASWDMYRAPVGRR